MSFGYRLLGFGSGAASGEAVLLADMVAYWSMDEASGTRADSHTNGYDLTDNNTVGSAAGVQGNAADFVAANSERLTITDADSGLALRIATDKAFFFWVNPDATSTQSLFGKGAEYVSWQSGTSQKVVFQVRSGGAPITLTHSATCSVGSWCGVYCEFDFAARVLAISVNDGGLETKGGLAGDPDTAAGLFEIGGIPLGLPYADKQIDEFGVWDRKLTAAEITWLNNSGSGRSWADIQAYTG